MSDIKSKEVSAGSHPFKEIEAKWRKFWEDNGHHTADLNDSAKKLYSLVMFSYPSGEKLHIGHWYNYGPADTWSRKKKMEGFNVFEPMGYDSFGLPAENFALKSGVHPAISTAANVDYIREQLKQIGAMYDWSKELATSDPQYYRWTQWLFLKFYEHSMAVRKEAPVNWCPSCKTVLANEQVINGRCERCETEITHKNLKQWFLRITRYADRLLAGLDRLDWPAKTIAMQRNWIGRSEGSEIFFTGEKSGERIPVFTTRADTLFGVTYIVLAPEHPLVEKITVPECRQAVIEYVERSRRLSEIERLSTVKEKTGAFTGSFALNPINGERIQIWIADYVLYSYGTGAVMAVPGHDQRDWEFATKFNLEIRQVIEPSDDSSFDLARGAFEDYGRMVNSREFTGLDSRIGMNKVTEKLKSQGQGDFRVNYKLRDWLISRQRYWGAPIPIIRCEKCGDVPVSESELPVLLPNIRNFHPTGEGESPLATSPEFVNVRCPRCGGGARRETETMDTFVDSSWYFLRFLDPAYEKGPWDHDLVRKWLPIDMYIGGAEHAVMHLMYARFFCMFLFDIGLVHFDEPFLKLRHQGSITSKGSKMSKSRGNVINPEHFLERYGSDTLRMYLMFMGSYSLGGDWDDSGINGISRFLGRVYRLVSKYASEIKTRFPLAYSAIDQMDAGLNHRLNLTIKHVSGDIETLEFNTAIAACMELVNDLQKVSESQRLNNNQFYYSLQTLVLLMAPMAPHLAEELWSMIGGSGTIFSQAWPQADPQALALNTITMVVQVNGRLRGNFDVPAGIDEDAFFKIVSQDERVGKFIEGRQIVKKVFVPGKLLNIVIR
ncbi:MAG: leucine--tRNA ligase [candidate division Zixibacteria bacterium RBG_16_53_22]|nr:MAG: leucine--tRNA ligase [candidate division Zixibacteria bacterium RBG_16_53_22]